MRLIDRYVESMVKFEAVRMSLRAGKPIELSFEDGSSRVGNTSIAARQIVQLIQETAPLAVLTEIKARKRGTYASESVRGGELLISVDTDEVGQWSLTIDLRDHKPGKVPDSGAVEPERPAPPKKRVVAEAADDEPVLHRFLRKLVRDDGSDLHMCSGTAPLYRVHGEIAPMLEGHPPLDPGELGAWMREVANEDAWKQFGEGHDADFAYEIMGVARFRINFFMDRRGPGMVARQIPLEILSAQQLGLPEKVLDLCWLSKGLVLVTGPTGSGKSTTLASMIDFVNDQRQDHIITIEDPIEFVHPNKRCLVNQREVGVHTRDFKTALRAALREDPDIVLVGEMRDLETISIAVETAETGHLVFGTLHTTTAPSTVDRIIDQFPPDEQGQIRAMLSESLRGVIAQTLCKKVGGGRVAAYEILFGNPAVSNLIREGKTYQLKSIMQTSRHAGMQTLNEHLMELVRSGQVEPREAYIKAVDKQALREQLQKANIALDVAEADPA